MKDNKDLALAIEQGLEYNMTKDVLIKPLEIVKVQKQFQEPTGSKKANDDGLEVNDYSKTKLVTKEVESNFQKGIVIALPSCLNANDSVPDYNLGDTVVFPKKFAIEFDLFKDSLLVKPYDIIAVVKPAEKQIKLKDIVANDISLKK